MTRRGGLAWVGLNARQHLALSKEHGMEMYQSGDKAHLKAMSEMQELMKSPDAVKEWFDNKRKEFDALPDS